MQDQSKTYSRKERLKLCYMVMQDVNHQLFTESVLDEILLSMRTEDMTNIIPTFIERERAIRVDNEYVVGIGATVTSGDHPNNCVDLRRGVK